jgi:Protein of unknown function (DUF1573)
MKKLIFIIGIFSTIFLVYTNVWAAPELSIAQDTFEFEPVPEGTVIRHNFIVNNTGDEPLVIKNILTG